MARPHHAWRRQLYQVNLESLADQLNQAAQSSTIVTILYRDADETRPPRVHRIVPIAATKKVLRARDVTDDRVRVLLLAQLTILSDTPVPSPSGADRPSTIRRSPTREVLTSVVGELKRLGWLVSVRGDRLSVHLAHSDGKPMAVASASIAPTARSPRGAPRKPWTVATSNPIRVRSVGSLEEAVDHLMTYARQHAPTIRPG